MQAAIIAARSLHHSSERRHSPRLYGAMASSMMVSSNKRDRIPKLIICPAVAALRPNRYCGELLYGQSAAFVLAVLFANSLHSCAGQAHAARTSQHHPLHALHKHIRTHAPTHQSNERTTIAIVLITANRICVQVPLVETPANDPREIFVLVTLTGTL